MKFLATLAIFLFSQMSFAAQPPDSEAFDQWLTQLKQEAVERGISNDVVEQALRGVHYIERVIQADRKQAEFTESYQDYIGKRVSEWRIEKGKLYLEQHGELMAPVTRRYGIPARFVAAIIGVETNYGTFTLQHEALNVLATLSFDSRRGDRFRKEIFAALNMLDKGHADVESLKSSWAGALGVPQFMPSTYMQFAVDYNNDGKKDIWTHGPDLWASVANYLSHYGWDSDETWARKVMLPASKQQAIKNDEQNYAALPKRCERYQKHLKGWRNLNQWNDQGVRRMNGMDLPKVDIAASLILTDPVNSHAYLVYGNFCTLMRYNPSFKYALSVGALADAIKS